MSVAWKIMTSTSVKLKLLPTFVLFSFEAIGLYMHIYNIIALNLKFTKQLKFINFVESNANG